MALSIRTQGESPTADELYRAGQVVDYAHQSAGSLVTAFNDASATRGSGGPSTGQGDLLRAMVLFAGAGLDSCAQQIVRDTLPTLVTNSEEAASALVGFTARRIRKQSEDAVTIDSKFLAEVLVGQPDARPQDTVIEKLIEELTGSSMQSIEELRRVAQHLGMNSDVPLAASINGLRPAFEIRNRIAHDMDIKFTEGRGRNRRPRRRDDMVKETNNLLEASELLVAAVDKLL